MTTHRRLGSTFLRPRNPRKYLVNSSFKAQVENLSGKRIKILRSDNGGEYTSTEFNDFCKDLLGHCVPGSKLEYVSASTYRLYLDIMSLDLDENTLEAYRGPRHMLGDFPWNRPALS